jgi:hypothetical protein
MALPLGVTPTPDPAALPSYLDKIGYQE